MGAVQEVLVEPRRVVRIRVEVELPTPPLADRRAALVLQQVLTVLLERSFRLGEEPERGDPEAGDESPLGELREKPLQAARDLPLVRAQPVARDPVGEIGLTGPQVADVEAAELPAQGVGIVEGDGLPAVLLGAEGVDPGASTPSHRRFVGVRRAIDAVDGVRPIHERIVRVVEDAHAERLGGDRLARRHLDSAGIARGAVFRHAGAGLANQRVSAHHPVDGDESADQRFSRAGIEEVAQVVGVMSPGRQQRHVHVPRMPREEAHVVRVRADAETRAVAGAQVQHVPVADRDRMRAGVAERCGQLHGGSVGNRLPPPDQIRRVEPELGRRAALGAGVAGLPDLGIRDVQCAAVDLHRATGTLQGHRAAALRGHGETTALERPHKLRHGFHALIPPA